MSSLVTVLCIALLAVIVQLNKIVDSAPPSAVDINRILDLVQRQPQNAGDSKLHRIQLRQDSSDSDTTDIDTDDYFSEIDTDSDDSDEDGNAKIRKERIIDLIEKVANEQKNNDPTDDRIIHRNGKPSYDLKNVVSRSEKYDISQINKNLQTQILEQLLSKGINDEERKTKAKVGKDSPKLRLKPNRLTNPLANNDVKALHKHNEITGLEDYSKVYIVLNPQAVRKSKNKNSLNELVSKVLALSSPKKERQGSSNKKQRRYKGFVLNDNQLPRRPGRESKETYGSRDSLADDYIAPKAPKRSQGAGGSLSGRTAIPYIGHRGDIYERDS